MSTPDPLAPVTPSPADVALLLLSRTEVDEGTGTRTFSTDTVPALESVQAAIANAVGELDDMVGLAVPVLERYRDEARRLAALRAAGQLLLSLDDESTEESKQRASYDAQWLSRAPAFAERVRGGWALNLT